MIEKLFGQNPFEQHLSFQGASLRGSQKGGGPFGKNSQKIPFFFWNPHLIVTMAKMIEMTTCNVDDEDDDDIAPVEKASVLGGGVYCPPGGRCYVDH